MKPGILISIVVTAILVTVVIEETRIKKLQSEIVRLRELPVRKTPVAATEEKEPAEPPLPASEPQPDLGGEPPASPVPPVVVGQRQIPADFEKPDDEVVHQLSQGPYAQLHLRLGMTNPEAAYLDKLLKDEAIAVRKLTAEWLTAEAAARPSLEEAIVEAQKAGDGEIHRFLGNDEDFATFSAYRERQPERELLAQLLPLIEQKGVVLEIDKEHALVDALHDARMKSGGIDWNSPSAMGIYAAGNAVERFERQWDGVGEKLRSTLAGVLEPAQLEAVLAARDQLKQPRMDNIKATAAAMSGEQP
jgi:hypothetical protein